MNQPAATHLRTALVTGATGVIGSAIAQRIAAAPGYEVVLLCRDPGKGRRVAEEIRAVTGNARVRYEVLDLSLKGEVDEFASAWQTPVHVLVNNAAITPRKREETADGVERQFATNVLGYFWMIRAFTPCLKNAASARVVNVASYWAGDLDLADLEFHRRRYDNNQAYRQSKQADRMLTVAFATRLKPYGITVNACHPGDADSRLSNDLGFGGHETPQEAARTPAWLAVAPEVAGVTGGYFEHCRPARCRFGEDLGQVEALFRACEGRLC